MENENGKEFDIEEWSKRFEKEWDETKNDWRERHDFIERKMADVIRQQMVNDAKAAQEFSELRKMQANTQNHLDHLTVVTRHLVEKTEKHDETLQKIS